jgi:hypothetical protein
MNRVMTALFGIIYDLVLKKFSKMKSHILKSISVIVLAVLMAGSTQLVSAQEQAAAPKSPEKKNANDEQFQKDYNTKMQKYEETYQKLKQKEASTNDPEMKADLNKMISQMDNIKSEMKTYKERSGQMSDAEKAKAHDHIKGQLDDLKKTHDAAKTKYGKSGKGDKSQSDKSGKQAEKQKATKSTNEKQQKVENQTNPK